MGANSFSPVEIDAIGEILNISLGSSATAASTMLDARVDITTPVVQVKKRDEFSFTNLEPAVGVEITYIDGLTGNNVMLLKRQDVKAIVEMLMGIEIADEDFELNEMNISAICEVMNQMMGASATALSELLGKPVNISTPKSYEITSDEQFKDKYFTEGNSSMVVISFRLKIAGKLESEFMNLMPIGLAKELVSGFFPAGMLLEEDEETDAAGQEENIPSQPAQGMEMPAAEAVMPQSPMQEQAAWEAPPDITVPAGANQPPAAQTAGSQTAESQTTASQTAGSQTVGSQTAGAQAAGSQTAGAQGEIPQEVPPQAYGQQPPYQQAAYQQAPYQQPPYQQPPYQQPVYQMPPDPAAYSRELMEIQKMQLELMEQMRRMEAERQERKPKQIRVHSSVQPSLHDTSEGIDPDSNLDLIMGVPVEVSVEIGRTKKLVKDILELNKGSLVVLDKLAGEQVDLFVNGQCIARGDVVVVDDNFGIRITQILSEDIPVA